jgi:hypothetical protein
MKLPLLRALACACLPVVAAAHDYPTIDRVEYVHACMRDNPGPAQEMTYKCSCVIDALARDLTYEQFVDASTAANAYSIAGEMGESIRNNDVLKKLAMRFRELQSQAKKSCFIG